VAFHERAWELASLRILGFTRNEVTGILLSELAVEVSPPQFPWGSSSVMH
jgi:putative ABC transport system permease protein